MPTWRGFFSYSSKDDQESFERPVTRLFTELKYHIETAFNNDAEVFRDREGLRVGDLWPDVLRQSVNGSGFFIPVLTSNFFASHFCRKEVKGYFEATKRAGVVPLVFPIYLITEDRLESYRDTPPGSAWRLLGPVHRFDYRKLKHAPPDERLPALEACARDMWLQVKLLRGGGGGTPTPGGSPPPPQSNPSAQSMTDTILSPVSRYLPQADPFEVLQSKPPRPRPRKRRR